MKFTSEIIRARVEARAKVEATCGKLKGYEYVHHIDCNPLNNDIDNLAIIDRFDHGYVHAQLKKRYPRKTIYYPEEIRETFKRKRDEKAWNGRQFVSNPTQNCQ